MGTAQPGSSMGRPMGTAMGGRPPQSSRMRGNLTSSMGTQAAQGVALATEVNVSDRPVTQQGMRGMKTGQGPARQVQDSSFYIGVLRAKVTELTAEIASLKNEVQEHHKGAANYSNLQRKHEQLLGEVRSLEGVLADYNLAMDKHRISTDPSELNDYINEFETKNRQFAAEVDRIFMMKKQQDQQTAQLEEQITQLHQAAQQKIEQLEPDKLERYNQLLKQSQDLRAQMDDKSAELDHLASAVRECEGESESRSFKEEFNGLQKRMGRVEKEEQSLMEELSIADLEPKEAQARLLAKVKKMNAQTVELDNVAKEMKGMLGAQKKQLQELNNELAERKGESGEKDKYEKLHQRDQEMTQFIQEFEMTRSSTVSDQQQTQDTIVALLEHISNGLAAEQDMPSQQRLKEMREEATFKEKQLESSQQTMQRLQNERKQRLAEMEKIKNLDEKIQIELASLTTKIESMSGEMVEFEDIDGLSRRASATVEYLQRLLKQYHARRESVKQQVAQLTQKYEGMKKSLASSDTNKGLTALEMKLRTYAQNIFALQEYVETKGRETDFESIKEGCNAIVDKLNQEAKERALTGPALGTQMRM